MHIDARYIDDNSVIEGDICIVGAGAAGITMALELMNTPYKVILLEGGGFDYDEKVQDLYRGKTTGQNYYPLKSARLHYFGGTSGHWGGLCSPFEPSIFEKRNWVNNSGWPIKEADLSVYYKRTHEILGLGEYSFNLDYWLKKNPHLAPLPLDEKAFFSKIWRYGISESPKFGKMYKDSIVNSGNVHLYTYANVVDIKANENVSAINEVITKNYAGKTHRVKAKRFILACCAIQNARLLLSANTQSAKGLGNDHDLVGRYFMENIEIKSGELWLKNPNPLQLYQRNKPNVIAELGLAPQQQEEQKILNGIISFIPLETARKTPPLIDVWTGEDPRENREKMGEMFEKAEEKGFFSSDSHESFEIMLRLEQAPNPLSRVTIDNDKDELGVPRASLHWSFTELENKSARKIYTTFGREVGIAGIGRVKILQEILNDNTNSLPAGTSGGWHHMGTTRMSDDPKKGVVNADCKVHGIDNLYIAGSGCFPNGAAVNPTFTIVTLSIRLSDHLKKTIQNSFLAGKVIK